MKTLTCMFTMILAVSAAQAQYMLGPNVFGSGGLLMTDSVQYTLHGTLGQATVGSSAGASNWLNAGFWYSAKSIATDVQKDDGTIPKVFALYPNYPNPFNPSTTIQYDLPQGSPVRLVVYDNLGRVVRTLVEANQPPGRHRVIFDAQGLSSGMYYYKIVAGEFVSVKKLLLLK
jgi:hypothetical protein